MSRGRRRETMHHDNNSAVLGFQGSSDSTVKSQRCFMDGRLAESADSFYTEGFPSGIISLS